MEPIDQDASLPCTSCIRGPPIDDRWAHLALCILTSLCRRSDPDSLLNIGLQLFKRVILWAVTWHCTVTNDPRFLHTAATRRHPRFRICTIAGSLLKTLHGIRAFFIRFLHDFMGSQTAPRSLLRSFDQPEVALNALN